MLYLGAFSLANAQAQISSEARREAARLERLAANVWDGIVDDLSFGYSWDQRTQLDVFNFVNGARYLNQRIDSGRASENELRDTVELLRLQSESVDRSLRAARVGRGMMRDWEEAKFTLDYLARAFQVGREPYRSRPEASAPRDNINNLRIEIKEVRSTGNFFNPDYRIRGVVTGRNIVSAAIFHEGRLLKSLPVRLKDRGLRDYPFETRIEGREGTYVIRVIDDRGFSLEQPLEIASGGLLPGFK